MELQVTAPCPDALSWQAIANFSDIYTSHQESSPAGYHDRSRIVGAALGQQGAECHYGRVNTLGCTAKDIQDFEINPTALRKKRTSPLA